MEYINNQVNNNSGIIHKVYTLGDIDTQYSLCINVLNIKMYYNLVLLIKDIISKHTIVHFYNNLSSKKVALLLFFMPARKLIIHERGTVWNTPLSRSFIIRFLSWKSNVVLANSNATKIMLEKKFNVSSSKIKVIYNGIDVSVNPKYRYKHKNKSTAFNVGFLGRLDTPKGAHVLIEAAPYLRNNIKIIIAGDGVLINKLKKQSAPYGCISFIGRIVDPYKFLNKIDLLVVPSIREPFGNVCLEAGLCKVPIIASNVDGIPEIIQNNVSGALITPTIHVEPISDGDSIPVPEFVVDPLTMHLKQPMQIDSKALAKKINEISCSPSMLIKYREYLYKKVINCFSIEQYSNNLYDLYLDIYNCKL